MQQSGRVEQSWQFLISVRLCIVVIKLKWKWLLLNVERNNTHRNLFIILENEPIKIHQSLISFVGDCICAQCFSIVPKQSCLNARPASPLWKCKIPFRKKVRHCKQQIVELQHLSLKLQWKPLFEVHNAEVPWSKNVIFDITQETALFQKLICSPTAQTF